MLPDLSSYEKYFKDGKDGKILVVENCPPNIKARLKKINADHIKEYGESIFEFEEG